MNRNERRRQKKLAAKRGGGGVAPLPPAAQDNLNAAIQCYQFGDMARARTFCQNVLAQAPRHPVAMTLGGAIALAGGDAEGAISLLNAAVEAHPGHFDAYIFLGNALVQAGRKDQAAKVFARVTELKPDDVDALINLGNIQVERGDFAAALDAFQRAFALDPKHASLRRNIGVTLFRMDQYEAAVEHLEYALQDAAADVELLNLLGQSHRAMGAFDPAVAYFERALEREPDNAQLHFQLASVFDVREQLDGAIRHYERAVALDADYMSAHAALGMCQYKAGALEAGKATLEQALARAPESAAVRNNLGVIQLTLSDFANGWGNYEGRFEIKVDGRPFPAPLWRGEDLSAKTLAVLSEQGVGEEILCASMFRELSDRAGGLVVECDPRMVPVFERSFPDIRFAAKTNPPDPALTGPEVDFRCPVVSLGNALRGGVAAFPAPAPYLKADAGKSAELRARYRDLSGGKPVVGISWYSGNAYLKALKNVSLEELLPVLSNPDYAFMSLQYGDFAQELADFRDKHGITIHHDPAVDPMADMDASFAQVDAVDMVVTISNATAHTAGALGKRTHVLLSYVPLWCWQLGREDTLWYENVRLHRQETVGDWGPVVESVARAL